MAVSGVVNWASTPPSAVSRAIVPLLLTDHAASTRATRSGVVCSSRYVAYTGLNSPQVTIRPSSTPMTMTSPAIPGRIATRPIGHRARSTPVASRIRRCP